MATEEDRKFYKEHRHEPYQQLQRAIVNSDLRRIRYLIRSRKVDPNVRGLMLPLAMPLWSELVNFLIYSSVSVSQMKELIRLLVAHGADIHVKGLMGFNILQATLSMPLLKFLLTEFKFSNEEIWKAFNTADKPLKFFIRYGLQVSQDMAEDLFRCTYDVKLAKFLMTKYHVSVNCADKDGLMPIHHAVQCSLEMVKFLLAHGADINSRSRSGGTPLMFATSLEIFNFLIEQGADVYAVDQEQWNVLLWQIGKSGSLAIIKALVEQYHFDVNQPDEAGTSPLMLAIKRGSLDATKYLVDNGANVNAVDNEGRNVLFYLYKHYELNKQLLQYLIAQGVNVNHLDKSGRNVLFYATKHIELLLKAGANVTVVADDGTTVLMNRRLSFFDFKRLIRHGADPSEYAAKLLRWWLADNHDREDDEKEIILYLIKKYSLDPNTRNEVGRTPLFYCLTPQNLVKSLELVKQLIKIGASWEVMDEAGNTPLIYYWIATDIGYLPELLLNKLPAQHYRRQNNEGKTALHYAVITRSSFNDIRHLLDHGADWRIKDNSGRTALDYARELKRFDICELMENYKHKNIKGS